MQCCSNYVGMNIEDLCNNAIATCNVIIDQASVAHDYIVKTTTERFYNNIVITTKCTRNADLFTH